MNKQHIDTLIVELDKAIANENVFLRDTRDRSKIHHNEIAIKLLSLYKEGEFNKFEYSIRERFLNYINANYDKASGKDCMGETKGDKTDIDKSSGYYFEDLMFALFKNMYGKIVVKPKKFDQIKDEKKSLKKLDIGIGDMIGIELKSGFDTTILKECFNDYNNLCAANKSDFQYFCIGGGFNASKSKDSHIIEEIKTSQKDRQWLFCLPNNDQGYQFPFNLGESLNLRYCLQQIDSLIKPSRKN